MLLSFPQLSKKVIISNPLKKGAEIEVTLFDLSIEYLHKVDSKEIEDNTTNALLDASDLDAKVIEKLRYRTGQNLYAAIVELTFGKDLKESDGQQDEKK